MLLRFDVAILGGGPGGSSAAIALLQNGFSVAIIEKSDYSETRIGETIPPQTSALLSDLKIDDELFQHHLPSNANESSWGSDLLEENNFFCNPFGHGWHLNRLKFDKQLLQNAEQSGAEIFCNSNIKVIELSENGYWSIEFANDGDNKKIRAGFAVDATGRNSFLTKKQGGKRLNIDHLVGVVCIHHNNLEKAHSNFTLIESAKNGWWYSADLPENKMVTAFMTDADLFKQEKQRSEHFWNEDFYKTKYTKLRVAKGATYNLQVLAANSYIMSKTCGSNWMAIGDAAMAYDPLSSAGIHKAIKDGVSAASAIRSFFAGSKNEIAKESENYTRRFIKYLERKKQYYSLEKRWASSPFWKRRILN